MRGWHPKKTNWRMMLLATKLTRLGWDLARVLRVNRIFGIPAKRSVSRRCNRKKSLPIFCHESLQVRVMFWELSSKKEHRSGSKEKVQYIDFS
jgi:hypothetical protein